MIDFEKYSGSDKHISAAAELEAWSVASGSMIPLSKERIESFPYSIMAFDNQESLVLGHIGISSYANNEAVIGGLVVNPTARIGGIGKALLGHLLGSIEAELGEVDQCIVRANPSSISLFEGAGGVFVAHDVSPANTGCDFVYDMTPVFARALSDSSPNLLNLVQ